MKTKRYGRIKQLLFTPENGWVGDVLLSVTPTDRKVLVDLLGKVVLIETTWTVLSEDEAEDLEAQISRTEKETQ